MISTIKSVVIMLCLSLTAFAETELQTPSDDDISVCYLYTDKISGTLSISNKAATCKSTVRGISGTTTKIESDSSGHVRRRVLANSCLITSFQTIKKPHAALS